MTLALLLGVLAAGAAQSPAREVVRGIPLVQLRVNDAPGWALVDTGSPWTYVDVGLREDLVGPPKSFGESGVPPKEVPAKLWIGGRVTERLPVRFLDLDPFNVGAAQRPVIAILGRDLLGRHAVGIDFRRQSLRLWRGGKVKVSDIERWAAGKDRSAIAVDIRQDASPPLLGTSIATAPLEVDPATGAWTISVRLGREPFSMVVDTGSSCTQIGWARLQGLGLKIERSEYVADVLGAALHRVVTVPRLDLGELGVRAVEVFAEEEGLHRDILAPKDMGLAWMVFDPATRKLYFPRG